MSEKDEHNGSRRPLVFSGASLAPMVRVSTLPVRLAALEFGASYVCTEDMIDRKLMQSKRIVDDRTGVTHFVTTENTGFLSTNRDDSPCVLQLGSCNPETARAGAEVVFRDFDGIDLNCGCPAPMSVRNGMGAVLLKDPEKVHNILSMLSRDIPLPISCKIRLLDSPAATVDFAKMIERSGCSAIIVHGRSAKAKRADRYDEPVDYETIKLVASSVSIPVIANGDVLKFSDIGRVTQMTGTAGVMIGRGAMWDISVFSPPVEEESFYPKRGIQSILRHALDVNFEGTWLKYPIVKHMKGSGSKVKRANINNLVVSSRNLSGLCSIFDVAIPPGWEKSAESSRGWKRSRVSPDASSKKQHVE